MPITPAQFNLHTRDEFRDLQNTVRGRELLDAALELSVGLGSRGHVTDDESVALQAYAAAFLLETSDLSQPAGPLVSTSKGPFSASWAAASAGTGAWQANRWGRLADLILRASPAMLGFVG